MSNLTAKDVSAACDEMVRLQDKVAELERTVSDAFNAGFKAGLESPRSLDVVKSCMSCYPDPCDCA